MSAKKQDNQVEALRNAATGYTVVVLAIICFVLALAVVMAGVRVVAGIAAATTATAVSAAPAGGSGAS